MGFRFGISRKSALRNKRWSQSRDRSVPFQAEGIEGAARHPAQPLAQRGHCRKRDVAVGGERFMDALPPRYGVRIDLGACGVFVEDLTGS